MLESSTVHFTQYGGTGRQKFSSFLEAVGLRSPPEQHFGQRGPLPA